MPDSKRHIELRDCLYATLQSNPAELDDGPDHRGDDICKFEWLVLGVCSHGVDLDKAFCPQGCRV